MGKYMRKAKISADVAVMEVSQATLGVRTRARTLALQRLQSSSTPPPPSPASLNGSDSSCYLQLRSRRLEKPSNLKPRAEKPPSSRNDSAQLESGINSNPRSDSKVGVSDSFGNSGSITRPNKGDGCFGSRLVDEVNQDYDFGVEASFGENSLGLDNRERSTRESTPCSLIRDVDVATPGSSTRPKTVRAENRRSQSAILENIPSTAEIEEFFARADQQQQRQFIERYNFDIVNDVPLPGRYEWVKVQP
ncbi:OLC1v1006791C1 [Oldenlandia corymbosa var. corymbosa]|uniref:OLC1v1006791C1 n=1 Tax=Oldenlandia corymbosa var. corymbosa TaxID=529605 RepID=A0AAV1DHU8_OLDCO|nr:OLC1v1006791C1 [Oldenlandia corymbosa var. corymbosa]